jgi:hypothetical protein
MKRFDNKRMATEMIVLRLVGIGIVSRTKQPIFIQKCIVCRFSIL